MSVPRVPAAIDQSRLPASSSQDLVVVSITPAEYEQTWYLNADEWKGPLSIDQYVDRERFLLKQDLTKDDGITGWILTSSKLPLNPDGTRPILASCETILKPAYVATNGSLTKLRAHGIASVYTRHEYRGRGYAGRMMAELGRQIETFQQRNGDKSLFSILFSDIGKRFYARYGWTAFPSTHIDLTPLEPMEYENSKTKFDAVKDITREGMVQLPMIPYLEEKLKAISKEHPAVPCVAVCPNMEHFDWHHAREEIQARILGLPHPQVKGAIHEATGVAIVWSRVFASKPEEWLLYVLHVVIPPELREDTTGKVRDALAALLLRAQREAHAWNMIAGVQVWDPSDLVVSAAQKLRSVEEDKVEIIHRDKDHISCLRLAGARTNGDTTNDVIWVSNEKYAWS